MFLVATVSAWQRRGPGVSDTSGFFRAPPARSRHAERARGGSRSRANVNGCGVRRCQLLIALAAHSDRFGRALSRWPRQPSTFIGQLSNLRFACSDRPVAQRPTRLSPSRILRIRKEAAPWSGAPSARRSRWCSFGAPNVRPATTAAPDGCKPETSRTASSG